VKAMRKAEKVEVVLDSETLQAASAAGLDLSQELAFALRRKLSLLNTDPEERKRAAQEWYAANKEAVDWHNQFIADTAYSPTMFENSNWPRNLTLQKTSMTQAAAPTHFF
jgi:post-segregation antitoxin (ccd killing protein)